MATTSYTFYNTKIFKEIYPTETAFLNAMPTIISGCIAEDSFKLTYFLLCARYGNSPIANLDEDQFKLKVASTIYQFGPTWEKKLEIQKALRNMSEEDLRLGAKTVYNHALNPSSEPATAELEEISYINDQNTSNYKKGKVESYALLVDLLKENVSGTYIEKFKPLFKMFVEPERVILYESED